MAWGMSPRTRSVTSLEVHTQCIIWQVAIPQGAWAEGCGEAGRHLPGWQPGEGASAELRLRPALNPPHLPASIGVGTGLCVSFLGLRSQGPAPNSRLRSGGAPGFSPPTAAWLVPVWHVQASRLYQGQ